MEGSRTHENLLKECERLEQKFKDGQQLSEQCRLMKQEALQEASLRRPLPPADFLNYVPPTDIPPWDLPSAGKGRVPEPAEKGRVPEPVGKGKVPLHPQGLLPGISRSKKRVPNLLSLCLLQGLLLGQDRCNLPGPGRS